MVMGEWRWKMSTGRHRRQPVCNEFCGRWQVKLDVAGLWVGWRAPRDPPEFFPPRVPEPRTSARWFPRSYVFRWAARRPTRFADTDAPTSGTPAKQFARGTPKPRRGEATLRTPVTRPTASCTDDGPSPESFVP